MKRQKTGLRTAAALCIVLLCAAAAACDSSGYMTVSCHCAYSRAVIEIPVKTRVRVDGGYTAAFSSGETMEALGSRIADDWGETGGTVTPAGDGLLLTGTEGAFSHYALLAPYDGGYNRILCNMAGFVGDAEKRFLLPVHLLADMDGITARLAEQTPFGPGETFAVTGTADEFRAFYESTGAFAVTFADDTLTVVPSPECADAFDFSVYPEGYALVLTFSDGGVSFAAERHIARIAREKIRL